MKRTLILFGLLLAGCNNAKLQSWAYHASPRVKPGPYCDGCENMDKHGAVKKPITTAKEALK